MSVALNDVYISLAPVARMISENVTRDRLIMTVKGNNDFSDTRNSFTNINFYLTNLLDFRGINAL